MVDNPKNSQDHTDLSKSFNDNYVQNIKLPLKSLSTGVPVIHHRLCEESLRVISAAYVHVQ